MRRLGDGVKDDIMSNPQREPNNHIKFSISIESFSHFRVSRKT